MLLGERDNDTRAACPARYKQAVKGQAARAEHHRPGRGAAVGGTFRCYRCHRSASLPLCPAWVPACGLAGHGGKEARNKHHCPLHLERRQVIAIPAAGQLFLEENCYRSTARFFSRSAQLRQEVLSFILQCSQSEYYQHESYREHCR